VQLQTGLYAFELMLGTDGWTDRRTDAVLRLTRPRDGHIIISTLSACLYECVSNKSAKAAEGYTSDVPKKLAKLVRRHVIFKKNAKKYPNTHFTGQHTGSAGQRAGGMLSY